MVARIFSGGQTGVDRAALDFAIRYGIPYGGWCPKGGWAEDMPDPPGLLAVYAELVETPSSDPGQRTEWNVRDSDATLIIVGDAARIRSRGTDKTIDSALTLGRTHAVDEMRNPKATEDAVAFLRSLPADVVLNIAGPRESEAPGIYAATTEMLDKILHLFTLSRFGE